MTLADQMTATLDPAGLARYVTRGRWVLAPHLELLNRRLVDLAAGRVRRLVVTMPPRYGKSEMCSVFLPAWYLGTYPDRRVMLASYESDFAATWGRRVRDLLDGYVDGAGVVSDGTHVWTANLRCGTISQIGPDTAAVDLMLLDGGIAAGIAYAEGNLWVTNEANQLVEITPP